MGAGRYLSHDFHPVAVLDAHPDGILVVDHEDVVRYANPAAAAAFDATLESIVGRQFSLPLDGSRSVELRASGDRLLRMRARPTLWGAQPARLVSLTDITDARLKDRQLEALAERLGEREKPVTDIEQLDLVCDALDALARTADALHARVCSSPGLLVRQAADTMAEHSELLDLAFTEHEDLQKLPKLLDDLAEELSSEIAFETATADHLRRAMGRLKARVRQIQRRAARGGEISGSWSPDPLRSMTGD